MVYTDESVIGMHDSTITDDQMTVVETSSVGDGLDVGDAVGLNVVFGLSVAFGLNVAVKLGAMVVFVGPAGWLAMSVGASTVTKPTITMAAPMYCRAVYVVRRRKRDMIMLT